jgi:hypothetical protein
VSDVIGSSIFVAVRCCDKVSLLTLIAGETDSKSVAGIVRGNFQKLAAAGGYKVSAYDWSIFPMAKAFISRSFHGSIGSPKGSQFYLP